MIRKLIAVLLLTGAGFAQMKTPEPGMRERRDDGRMEMKRGMAFERGPMEPMMLPGGKFWTITEVAQDLGLTSAQVQQMEKIFQDSRLQLIDRVAAVQKAEAILEPMLQADRPDENAVLAQIDKVAQARAELEKTNARMMLGIRQVMSTEQWNKLKSGLPRHRRGPDGPGQPSPEGPPPPQGDLQ